MNNVRQTPTEDCPLTKENYNNCLNTDCCKCGFKTIISIFVVLTAAITVALILQLIYQDGLTQSSVDYHGAVATDSANCSLIGTKILHKGGNAVDAAIAAALCTTVLLPHKTGLGGGGYIMIYNFKYGNNPILIDFAVNSIKGELNQAKLRIPTVLKGFEYTHSLYGNQPWRDLIEPTINLAENGFIITQELSQFLKSDDQFYGKRIHAGDVIKLPVLVKTLKLVASKGTMALYNGTQITEFLHTNSSPWKDLFREELTNYLPVKKKNLDSLLFYNHEIFFPKRAILLKSLLKEINKLNISLEKTSAIDSQSQVINAFVRISKDAHDVGEEGRYTSVVSIDGENTLVCVLSGMNNPFSEQFMTAAGFALDIVLHTDYLNSLVPIAFYNSNNPCRFSGIFGTDDQTLVSQILYKLIARSLNITQAIESSRYYMSHDGIAAESDDTHAEDAALRLHLKSLFRVYPADETSIMKSVNIVIKRFNLISSHSDSRGEGIAYRF